MSTEQRHVDEAEARRVAEAARETDWRKPSFAKQLFLGDFRLDLVHPHPRPDAADDAMGREFCERLARFLDEHVDAAQIERDAKIPQEVIDGLAELGAFGMKIDEQYGGLGLSTLSYGRAIGLLGSVNQSLVALVSAHQSIGVPQPLKLFGSEEQKREYLPRCARGEISAFLLTEPDVGSDPARMGMTAVPTDDGYVLNGTKLWTTNGTIADLLVVMARVPDGEGHRGGISAFVVEADAAGIEVTHRNAFMGLRGIENGVTRFTDVRIPASALIGKEGMGLKIALTTLNAGRLSIPAACAATAKWCLKVSREWARDRVQWGQPVGKHEAVASKLTWMAGMAFALESVFELAAAMDDEDRKDIRIEAAIAKLYASEAAWQVADTALQIRGGRGFETAESLRARGEVPVPVEQVLRDLRINRIFEGSSEIMKLMIAREAVDQHLQVAGDIIEPDVALSDKAKTAVKAGGFYARYLPSLVTGRGQVPLAYAEFGELARHLRYVERSSRRLARCVFYAMSRYQGKMQRKQALLGRVVDIGAELFAMSATIVRAKMLADDDLVEGTLAVDLAEVFCRGARRRIEVLFDALFRNDDEADYRFALRVLEGRHSWVEVGIADPYGLDHHTGGHGEGDVDVDLTEPRAAAASG
jgi:alkylation response protein AidB-like acyl-CoA dehydrogenase